MSSIIQRISLLLLGLGLACGGVWLAITVRSESPSVATPGALLRPVTSLYRDSSIGLAFLALVGVVLIIIGLLMTIRQLRPQQPQVRTATLATSSHGVTTADTRAVTRAVARDASTITGVTTTDVRLTELSPARALLHVGIAMDADLPSIVDSLGTVVDRLTSMLGAHGTHATASIAFTDDRLPRVE